MKNMNDIRTVLSEEVQRLREGKTTAANVNAVTNAIGKIIVTVKLELEMAKQCGAKPKTSFIEIGEPISGIPQIEPKPPETKAA